MTNHTMIQFFEWDTPANGNHWRYLGRVIPELVTKGVHGFWIPPPMKGTGGSKDVGYGVYDLWDLGEFKQKGTVRTKYGTKKELIEACAIAKKHSAHIYADIVLNHKAGADEKEKVWVREVDEQDRERPITDKYEIEAWTKFTFPGRKGKYSEFQWNHNHFSGTDWDDKNKKKAIFLFDGKKWSEAVTREDGVLMDYLMFANIDYSNQDVVDEITRWGDWIVEELSLSGFRIDAIKHFDANFTKGFLNHIREKRPDFFAVGESWTYDLDQLTGQLELFDNSVSFFDFPLYQHFRDASRQGRDYDMKIIFSYTFVARHPINAVTFVENHDIARHDDDKVLPWFRPLAYALILLRTEGYPCVFISHLYPKGRAMNPTLSRLLELRHKNAYGDQTDYFDHNNTIGWVRHGDDDHKEGLAVVMCTGESGFKKMNVGAHRAGQKWVNALSRRKTDTVTIDKEGNAEFKAEGGSVAVWVRSDQNKNSGVMSWVWSRFGH